MSDKKYNITLTGKLSPGTDPNAAVDALAAMFKLEKKKAIALLRNAPKTVKKDAPEAEAKKYLAAFKKAGIVAKADEVGASEESAASVDQADIQTEPSVPVAESVIEDQNEPVSADIVPETNGAAGPAPTQVNPIVTPEEFAGYEYSIIGRPDYGFINVKIPANETLKVEASAMATMDTHLRMKTKMKGGLGRLLTGENIFINEFTAENADAEIGIAPATPGDVCHQYLDGNTIFLQNSAFVASAMDVNVETKWQGMLKGFFSGESLFLIRCSGKGDLWFNTYGAMIEIDVKGDYVVDTGNIVAFTEGLDYRITKVGGYKSLFFSGEGFVCRFSGEGKVWIQTRSAQGFAAWAQPFRPVKKK